MTEINSDQIRAARGLLKWTQADLADKADISLNSVKNIENELTELTSKMQGKIYEAFFKYGIEFLPNSGVRRLDDRVIIYENEREHLAFFESVSAYAQKTGGPIFVDGVLEAKFLELLPDKDARDRYVSNMSRIENIDFRIICEKGVNQNFVAPYAEYKEIESEYFSPVVYYIYGNRVALILWSKPHKIISIKDPDLVKSYSRQFLRNWERATLIERFQDECQELLYVAA